MRLPRPCIPARRTSWHRLQPEWFLDIIGLKYVSGFSLAEPNAHRLNRLPKMYLFCHSERSEESLFDCKYKKTKKREILRFAQNDKTVGFSAACEAYAT
jgi:hypothetical protein